jgi:hypothetical protein
MKSGRELREKLVLVLVLVPPARGIEEDDEDGKSGGR